MWVAVGIGAWFVVSIPVALVVGRLLRRSAECCHGPCEDVADVEDVPAVEDAADVEIPAPRAPLSCRQAAQDESARTSQPSGTQPTGTRAVERD